MSNNNKQSSSKALHYFMDYYTTNGNPCSVESIPEPISIVSFADISSSTSQQVWPVMVSCYDLVVDKDTSNNDNNNENNSNNNTTTEEQQQQVQNILQPKVQHRIGRMDLHLITVPDITSSADHHTSVPLQFNLQQKQQETNSPKHDIDNNSTNDNTATNNNDIILSTGILDGKWNRIPQPSSSVLSLSSISNSLCLDDTIHTGTQRIVHNKNNNNNKDHWSFVSAHSDGTICIHALDISTPPSDDTATTNSTSIENTNISKEKYTGSMRLLGKSNTIDSLPTTATTKTKSKSSASTTKTSHDDYYYDNESDTDNDDDDEDNNNSTTKSTTITPLCLSVAWDTPNLYNNNKKQYNDHHVNNYNNTTNEIVPISSTSLNQSSSVSSSYCLSSQNVGAKVDRIVSTYSNGIAAIHDVVFMYNNNIVNSSYNSNNNNNSNNNSKSNNNNSTDCTSVQIIEYERWLAHYNTIGSGTSSIQTPAEVWTACFLHTTNNNDNDASTNYNSTSTIVLTGGDDGYCKVWDIRSIQRPMQTFTSANKHTTTNEDTPAGITCLSPHPYYTSIVAVGSYDETISLYDMRYVSSSIRPVPLCTISASASSSSSNGLGGGVWRMKWHPYTYHRLLIGAMHGGAFVYNFRNLSSYWDTTKNSTSTSTRNSNNINSNKNTNIYNNTSTTNTTTLTNDSTVTTKKHSNTTTNTTTSGCFYFDEKDAVPVDILPTTTTTSNTNESKCFYLEEKDAIPVVTTPSNVTNTKKHNTLSYGFVPRHLQGSNMNSNTNSKVDQQQSLYCDDDGILPMTSHHSSGDDEDMFYYNLNNSHCCTTTGTSITGTGNTINKEDCQQYNERIIVKPKCKKKFGEHESMVYGADWIVCPHPTQNGHFEAAISCSFYDRSVYLWDTIF